MKSFCLIVYMLAVLIPATLLAAKEPTLAETQATRPAVSPEVMDILSKMEEAGKKYRTIRADVKIEVIDRLTGDSERRTGWVAYYAPEGNKTARWRAHFDTLKLGAGPVMKKKLDYAFDGHFLTIAKHDIKDMRRIQVVPEGEQAEPMRLGEGPFPLPFGQKADVVVEHFRIETRPAAPGEPKHLRYLKLIPRRDQWREMDIVRLEMWIDQRTYLPVRVVSRGKDKKTTEIRFNEVRTNIEMDPKLFHMPRPAGWSYQVKPLEKQRERE